MKEARKPDLKGKYEDPTPTPSAQQDAPPPQAQEAKPAGLKYVFKIAPADPKNSFDFEDVADK